MTGKTHASCGMLVGALTTQYFQTDIFSSVTVIILATLASLLPDICHTQSKIGRRFKVISFFVRLIFVHRTFTHSILFIAIIAFLLQIIQTPNSSYGSNYNWISVTCHTRYDNTKGVKLFYPLPFNVKTPIQFKTGGLVDLSLATALMVGTVSCFISAFHQ
ncbi:metal-dependent hydrolase [Staphylococcus aureus]